ncbi:hypothetical protein CROQUDRAFT_656818 [Cronartium quercuum f. sp. fusiforme G11]|uniref:Uncharacterized protein n=1 Tax=Cronartium quercuum f. sp. fusiforme G11 TaxID=708437 RepID=A0A9P6NMG5_9BASI|nr:hypothetical protein CROQUDRAFT_656818 [Cronartium quercuum f. sp. fusiforme G11]
MTTILSLFSKNNLNPRSKSYLTKQLSTQQPPPLPNSIRDAWKAGLKGHHPNQYSRLQEKSATPIHMINHHHPHLDSNQTINQKSTLINPNIPSSNCESIKPLQPKLTLLQTYLNLNKRSQRFVSISIFIWALSGFTYFTWFSVPPN